MEDLWGLGPIEEPKKKEKKVIEKIKTPKDPSAPKTKSSKGGAKKLALPLSMQIEEIRKEVFRILGKYAENTICIRDVDTFNKYIDACIHNNIVAIDTETNNSIVPHTCKLMGLCLYTPGQKNAYIPVNHIDIDVYQQGVDQLSDEDRKKKLVDIDMSAWEVKLPNQLTEKQINEGLTRLMLSTAFTELSNGKFDYEVLKCTCDVEVRMDWDTQYVAQLINENEEFKGLKPLYRKYIDSSDDKYDIEGLFEGLPYAIFDPELFALYAATDPYKTHMVSQYQIRELNKPDNAKILQLYNEIEKPLQKVVADMELRGVTLDTEITNALSVKYHKQLEEAKKVIDIELANLEPKIDAWRQTPEANYRYLKEDWLKKNPTINPSKYATNVLVGDKNKWRLNSIENMPFKIDEACAKSLNQQLSSPVCLTSPQQVAILLYDVLNVGVIDKKSPRSTGDDVMSKLEADIPLCRAIQDQKHMNKFLGTYIDKIPACVIPKTGAVHCSFKQDGAATGRFSSTDPNLQNIPSGTPEIRLMFQARDYYEEVEGTEDYIDLYEYDLVTNIEGKEIYIQNISVNEKIQLTDDKFGIIIKIDELPDLRRRLWINEI